MEYMTSVLGKKGSSCQRQTKRLFASNSISVSDPDVQKVPLVVSSPHSGRNYPKEFQKMSRLPVAGLERSEDRFVDMLIGGGIDLGIPVLAANFPRSFVDLNRSPLDLDPQLINGISELFDQQPRNEKVKQGLGVVPRLAGNGAQIYRRTLQIAEVRRRLLRYYFPYHKMLKHLLVRTYDKFGFGVILDFHSMPSKAVNKRYGEECNVVIGDAHGRSARSDVATNVAEIFVDMGYKVLRNKPYAGGFITQHYGQPQAGISAIQIEISRAIYMNEKTLEPNGIFSKTRSDITSFLDAFAKSFAVRQPAE